MNHIDSYFKIDNNTVMIKRQEGSDVEYYLCKKINKEWYFVGFSESLSKLLTEETTSVKLLMASNYLKEVRKITE